MSSNSEDIDIKVSYINKLSEEFLNNNRVEF